MLSRLDANTAKFLSDLASINRSLERAQREVSSGRRVHSVSDDPDEVTHILQLRSELVNTQQVATNMGRVKSEVDAAESVLQAAVSVMEKAATLATQGTGPDMSADRRQMIALQVDSLLQEMVVLSRTTVEGRFVFGGDADGQNPFTLDLTLADPVGVYQGAAATRQIMDPSGNRLSVARDGQTIFDNPDPALNAFNVINELRFALRANDDTALQVVLAKTKGVESHLNGQLAFYGNVQNQVATATDSAQKQNLRLTTRLSEIEASDMTEAIVAMTQAKYQQEVALTSQAKLPRTSLFDYLG